MSYKRLDSLEGKVAVITGCVGEIGFATATRLAERGAIIVGLDRRPNSDCQPIMDTLPNANRLKHTAIYSPINDSKLLNAAAEQVKKQFGRCDIVVNCAGLTK